MIATPRPDLSESATLPVVRAGNVFAKRIAGRRSPTSPDRVILL
jgi:hypothetical protein